MSATKIAILFLGALRGQEPAESSVTTHPNVVWNCGVPKTVALTYDDGPDPKHTAEILDVLRDEKIKATFFVVGSKLGRKEEQDVLKRIHADGHTVGNHSWAHRDPLGMSIPEICADIKKTDEKIKKLIGVTPRLFRPPFGSATTHMADALGKKIVLWNLDIQDLACRTPEEAADRLELEIEINQITDQPIILLQHDTHPNTAQAQKKIISVFRNLGYSFLPPAFLPSALIAVPVAGTTCTPIKHCLDSD
ncbi:MAG: uncharacterized protein A8A55_0546 [Amphiamblys sp. WSBS2006]|nr:MAG: uncharacterized protein A8A55_0546 [Amphiamblys sp. WSBS2006]